MPSSKDSRWTQTGEHTYTRQASVEVSGALNAEAAEEAAATAAAIKLAEELGVDIASIEGTGKYGKVTVGDVRDAAE